jgi:hypothetical protein
MDDINRNYNINSDINSMKDEETYLLHLYSPLIYFHKNEQTTPMDFQKYLLQCELYIKKQIKRTNSRRIEYHDFPKKSKKKETLLLLHNEIVLPLPDSINNIDRESKYLKFNNVYESPKNRGDLNDIPIYGRVDDDIHNSKYILLTYYLFFPVNTGYRILGLFNAGYHTADVETIQLRVNRRTMLIDNIYLSAHGNLECQTYSHDDPEILYGIGEERKKIIVYSSKNSHALYPQNKKYYRIAGLCNDITGKDYLWNPDIVVNLKKDNGILNFNCYLGVKNTGREGSVNDFNSRRNVNVVYDGPTRRISPFRRLFLCFFK